MIQSDHNDIYKLNVRDTKILYGVWPCLLGFLCNDRFPLNSYHLAPRLNPCRTDLLDLSIQDNVNMSRQQGKDHG